MQRRRKLENISSINIYLVANKTIFKTLSCRTKLVLDIAGNPPLRVREQFLKHFDGGFVLACIRARVDFLAEVLKQARVVVQRCYHAFHGYQAFETAAVRGKRCGMVLLFVVC